MSGRVVEDDDDDDDEDEYSEEEEDEEDANTLKAFYEKARVLLLICLICRCSSIPRICLLFDSIPGFWE